MPATPAPTPLFVRHALIAIGLVGLALLLWEIRQALLLGFGGVLLAVLLHGLAARLHRWTSLPMGAALAAVGVALLALLGATIALIGPQIANEAGALHEAVGKGMHQLRGHLEQSAWGREIVRATTEGIKSGAGTLGIATTFVVGAMDALLGLVVVVFTGVYLAASPRTYREGSLMLLPKARHARMREVLDATGNALWWWLMGQLLVMLAVGVLTALGLALVGVPLAIPLGVIAGLLEFIPFLGPFMSAVPVLLVAMVDGPQTAIYAALVLLVVQQLEGHLLTPLAQRWAVTLPPVLVIVGAIALTLLFGTLGAVFATPLLVVVLVWSKMLYMQDALQEDAPAPGEKDQG